jgi:sensor histidine kinase YesM
MNATLPITNPISTWRSNLRDVWGVGVLAVLLVLFAQTGPALLLWGASPDQLTTWMSQQLMLHALQLSVLFLTFLLVYSRWRIRLEESRTRMVYRIAGTGVAAGAAAFLMFLTVVWLRHEPLPTQLSQIAQTLVWTVNYCAFVVLVFDHVLRQKMTTRSLHEANLRSIALEREAAVTHEQLLQAQVEPHFIFNALANVRRLLRTDAAASKAMLGDMLQYLKASLPALRSQHSTLAQEAELVRSFLAIHQVRMGQRLRSSVSIDPALAQQPIAPMALLTLVENALKHGLAPLVEGGEIHVSARQEGSRVVVSVADTGKGMGSGLGSGTGLANVQLRMKALHGGSAQLGLGLNSPRGVIASISWEAA